MARRLVLKMSMTLDGYVGGPGGETDWILQLGLIDEYRLVLHPVVLGAGFPLFERSDPFDLTLVSTTPFAGGALAQVYRPR